jgi:hypothetical protein
LKIADEKAVEDRDLGVQLNSRATWEILARCLQEVETIS